MIMIIRKVKLIIKIINLDTGLVVVKKVKINTMKKKKKN